MKQAVCYAVAVLLHLAVLLCLPAPAPRAPVAPEEKKYLEVTLAAAPPPPAEILPAPPPPIPPPEPPPPPPVEKPTPPPEPPPMPLPPPPPEAMTLPTPAPTPVQSAPAPPLPAFTPAPPAPSPPAPRSVAAPPSKYVDILKPFIQTQAEPDYPRSALRLHQEGNVTLGLYINELGTLDKVEVVKSSGYPALDDAAVEAMKQSTFHPAYQGATPVPSHAEITINFQLK